MQVEGEDSPADTSLEAVASYSPEPELAPQEQGQDQDQEQDREQEQRETAVKYFNEMVDVVSKNDLRLIPYPACGPVGDWIPLPVIQYFSVRWCTVYAK